MPTLDSFAGAAIVPPPLLAVLTIPVHTVTANTVNRLGLVAVTLVDPGAVDPSIVSITWGGFALTFVGTSLEDNVVVGVNSTTVRVELWRIIGPPLGASAIVITASGLCAMGAQSASGYDFHQTSPVRQVAVSNNVPTSQTRTTVPATRLGSLLYGGCGITASAMPATTSGINQTDRGQINCGLAPDAGRMATATRPGTGGDADMVWDAAAPIAYAEVVAELVGPAAAAGGVEVIARSYPAMRVMGMDAQGLVGVGVTLNAANLGFTVPLAIPAALQPTNASRILYLPGFTNFGLWVNNAGPASIVIFLQVLDPTDPDSAWSVSESVGTAAVGQSFTTFGLSITTATQTTPILARLSLLGFAGAATTLTNIKLLGSGRS